MGGRRHAPAALPSGKRPGTHCIGGWLGPRAGLDGCGNSRPHWDSIPGQPRLSLYRLGYPGPQDRWLLRLNMKLYQMHYAKFIKHSLHLSIPRIKQHRSSQHILALKNFYTLLSCRMLKKTLKHLTSPLTTSDYFHTR